LIDFDFSNNAKPQKGSILVSEPFLVDDYFSRSVIYLCDHNEEGSFGFVLNKYVDIDLKEGIEDFPMIDFKVSRGGPVDTSNLFYLHNFGNELKDAVNVNNGLYIGGSYEEMISLITKNPDKAQGIRFFMGYSGWEVDQLQDELDEKSWIVLNNISTKTILNTENDQIWNDIMERLGGKFKIMSSFPKNPSDN